MIFVLLSMNTIAQDEGRFDVSLLNRIYDFPNSVDTTVFHGLDIYTYRKLKINVVRRNLILFPIPTMYRIAHSKARDYIEENYSVCHLYNTKDYTIERLAHTSTIPQQKETMTRLQKFLTPKFYEETIFGNSMLSPFHRNNRVYYRFQFKILHNNQVEITFYPKVKNTQLVTGGVIVESKTGRIRWGRIAGEFDMINFTLNFVMSDDKLSPVIPQSCELNAKFKFMGNIVKAQNTAIYGMPALNKDSLGSLTMRQLMDSIRHDTLTTEENAIYTKYYAALAQDSTVAKNVKRSWAKRFFWDVLGDNLLNKISSNYGNGNQGQVNINPLFNPLYMGYSGRKGYYYKFDVRNLYNFSTNHYLYTRLKAGYSFKQRQLYFTLPIEYHFDKRHNGYVKLQLGNGNWISNGMLKDEMLASLPSNTPYNGERIDYFRDFHLTLESSYDWSRHITLQVGMVGHKRTAVERHTYQQAHVPTSYTSVAPKAEIIWRPTGWRGPAVNVAYERSIRGLMDADLAYERVEFDIQQIVAFNRLKYLSFRAGCGFYTLIDGTRNFLDYSNFRDNNIPDGWYDEWTGEFTLLPSHWYNLSRYYVRTNATYETPLLALSHIPLIGRYIEKERIYTNILFVTHLHPYTEVGYGFTTRWISTGVFMAHRNGRFDGVGIKIGLELFRQW